MELVLAISLVCVVFAYVVFVRPKDIPAPEPVSPVAHLDEKKARIYEGLRDLQFEYRVGKLSDDDYQRTKLDLQRELAGVMAEIESIIGKATAPAAKAASTKPAKSMPAADPSPFECRHCGARFDRPMKFCGQCGKSMEVEA